MDDLQNNTVNPENISPVASRRNTRKQVVSRFSEARLLVLTLRRICNLKINEVFDILKIQKRILFKQFLILNSLFLNRKKYAITLLQLVTAKRAFIDMKNKQNRVQIVKFSMAQLLRLYHRKLASGLHQILKVSKNNQLARGKMEKSLEYATKAMSIHNLKTILTNKILNKLKIKVSPYVMKSLDQKMKYKTSNLTEQALKRLWIYYCQIQYSSLLLTTKIKRQETYNCVSNRRETAIKLRSQNQSLKLTLDHDVQQNIIKVSKIKKQYQTQIKSLKNEVDTRKIKKEQIEEKVKILTKNRDQIDRMCQARLKLRDQSIGSDNRVKQLLQLIKKGEFGVSKAKNYYDEYLKLLNETNSFQMQINIRLHSQICEYENVSLDTIKLSQIYEEQIGENKALKKIISSVFNIFLFSGSPQVLSKLSLSIQEDLNAFPSEDQFKNTDYKQISNHRNSLLKNSTTSVI